MTERKTKKFYQYWILFFAVISAYSFCVVNGFSLPRVDPYVTYTYHCVDYSMGFCSRFLNGGLYNLFVKDPSPASATVFELIVLFSIYAGVTFLLARWTAALSDENRMTGLRLVCLLLTGSCAFPVFSGVLGMLEVFWVVFGILFILCLQNRYLRFLSPVLMFCFLLTHIGAMLSVVPLFALLLLYEYSLAEDKKEKRIWLILFFVSCTAAVLSFCYFVGFEKRTLTYDIYEFNKILESRGTKGYYYYDFSLYANNTDYNSFAPFVCDHKTADSMDISMFVAGEEKTGLAAFFSEIKYQTGIRKAYYLINGAEVLKKLLGRLFIAVIITFPVIAVLFKYVFARFKAAKGDGTSRFIWFCAIVFLPFTVVCSIPISDDTVRWLAHAILCVFTLLLYTSYREKQSFLAPVRELVGGFSPAAVTAYQVVYALSVFGAYSL